MASKFEKEEKFNYGSNTDSDTESNNSKSRSGSSSPTSDFEGRIVNETGRVGGPNAPDYLQCFNCGRTCNLAIVIYHCGDRILLCNECMPRYYDYCPWHPQSRWKKVVDILS